MILGFNTIPFNPFPPSSESVANSGSSYELPIAGAETLGGVKVGSGLSINSETGVLTASGYELPIAGAETLGGVKVGSGLSINSETGVLSNSNPTPYSLPTASAETLGGVKVGSGLSIADGVLSSTGGITKKQKSYTGTGTNPNVIDFGSETPKAILAIYPEPNETVTTNDYNMVDCFSYGQLLLPAHWTVKTGNLPNISGNHGFSKCVATYNGNIISITGGSEVDCCNVENMKYVIDYLV